MCGAYYKFLKLFSVVCVESSLSSRKFYVVIQDHKDPERKNCPDVLDCYIFHLILSHASK